MMKTKSKGPYQVRRKLLIGEFVFTAGSAFPGTRNRHFPVLNLHGV